MKINNSISDEKKKEFNLKYLDRFVEEHKKGNWAKYRNKESESNRFYQEEKTLEFIGPKNVYIPIESEYNLNLQESRGIGISKDTTIDAIIEESKERIKTLSEGDLVRSSELDSAIGQIFQTSSGKEFLEIGFRIPKVQTHYKNTFSMNTTGIDINSFNVELFSEMGFNCHLLDLMKNESISEKLEKTFDVVVCYHVLEHITNPDEAVKNIFNSMNTGGIFHIEIPIEPGVPRLEYGHLISYEPKDMLKILEGVGFKVLYGTNATHAGGPWIERYIAVKE